MDPRKANGGVFLGLNGIVIKSHGGTDAEGFAAAVDVGYDMVALRTARQDQRYARFAMPATRRTAQGRRGCFVTVTAFGRARLRQLSARAGPDQCRSRRGWSTPPTSGSCSAPASASATSRPTGEADLRSRRSRPRAPRSPTPRLDAQSIDLIVLATSTPDNTFPATAVAVQAGARHHPRRGLRPAGGVLRLRLSRWRPPTACCAPARTSARW